MIIREESLFFKMWIPILLIILLAIALTIAIVLTYLLYDGDNFLKDHWLWLTLYGVIFLGAAINIIFWTWLIGKIRSNRDMKKIYSEMYTASKWNPPKDWFPEFGSKPKKP